MRPRLHVQNLFDALNPNGTGVTGDLKLRCLHLQKRVLALAKPGRRTAGTGPGRGCRLLPSAGSAVPRRNVLNQAKPGEFHTTSLQRSPPDPVLEPAFGLCGGKLVELD